MASLNKILIGSRLLRDTLRMNVPALAASLFQLRQDRLPHPDSLLEVEVSPQPIARVSERFLSFTIDIAQVVGGKFWGTGGSVDWVAGGSSPVEAYDFHRPKLRQLVKNLSPAYFRIGGTAADETFYVMGESLVDPPPPYKYALIRDQWEAANHFAQEAGLELVFTLNAGKGPRNSKDCWNVENARELIEYSGEKGFDVAAWSLGNEPNLFPFTHGLWLSMEQFAEEQAALKETIKGIMPQTKLLGPSCAFWPVVGELLPIFPRFLKEAGHQVDVVTWHYYPQQSRRSPIATRRASAKKMLSPSFFNETDRWVTWVERYQEQFAPHAEVWLEETGNAQCGGEPGLSDRFIAGFWWLDLLGRLARSGQRVVMRQNLSGADYSLIHDDTLEPNPDYWNSLLWKRLMGAEVMQVELSKRRPDLQVYAHRKNGELSKSVTVLALNTCRDEIVALDFGRNSLDVFLCTADDVMGRDVLLNGRMLETRADGSVPEFEPTIVPSGILDLPPVSYAFIQLDMQ
jgi:heparanase 1